MVGGAGVHRHPLLPTYPRQVRAAMTIDMVPWRFLANRGAGLSTSLQNAARKDMDQQQASVLL